MHSSKWAPSPRHTLSNPQADPSAAYGCRRGPLEGKLCVYADPLYRAPTGTPAAAAEECRVNCRVIAV